MNESSEKNKSSIIADIKNIIEQSRSEAYSSVSGIMIETYWQIGKHIVDEEQGGGERAVYGKQLIDKLSKRLTYDYGEGFSARYLRAFRKFYIVVPDFEIWKSRFPNLQWTHIFRTLRVGDETAIRWYLETASQEMWSVELLTGISVHNILNDISHSPNCLWLKNSPNNVGKSNARKKFICCNNKRSIDCE